MKNPHGSGSDRLAAAARYGTSSGMPAADAAPPTETAPVSVADDTDTHEGVVPDATDAE